MPNPKLARPAASSPATKSPLSKLTAKAQKRRGKKSRERRRLTPVGMVGKRAFAVFPVAAARKMYELAAGLT